MRRPVRVPAFPWWAFWTVWSTVILWANTCDFLRRVITLPHNPFYGSLAATLDALFIAACLFAVRVSARQFVRAWHTGR